MTAPARARPDAAERGSLGGEVPGAQQVARAFVISLHTAMRAVRMYPIENAGVKKALAELSTHTTKVFSLFGHCELRAVGDYLFVNGTRLRLQMDSYAAAANIIGRLREAGVGGIIITSPPDARSWVQLMTHIAAPSTDMPEAERVRAIVEKLVANAVTCFEIDSAADEDIDDDEDDEQERARQTYMRSLHATRDLLNGARMGRSPALKQAKRAVQGIVDSVMSNSTSLVGLTTLREFDEYTFVHSVNVCILSVALGRRIGLAKNQLLDLGLAALMHDIGKSRLPLDVLNKKGKLEDSEFAIIQSHTWRGILSLFAMRGSASRSWRTMIAAYEHHMRMDLSGYPHTVRPRKQSLFSKIVSIVDGFDAATSTRVYQPRPWSPADVVRGMRENTKLGLDPVLVKAFINLTGIYPVGTVIMLDTHELAIVHQASTDSGALARPVVRLLSDAMGNRLGDGAIVDLTDKGPDGRFLRTIIKTEDPDRHGIRVADYFV